MRFFPITSSAVHSTLGNDSNLQSMIDRYSAANGTNDAYSKSSGPSVHHVHH